MRYEIQLERMRSDAMQLGYLHGFKFQVESKKYEVEIGIFF